MSAWRRKPEKVKHRPTANLRQRIGNVQRRGLVFQPLPDIFAGENYLLEETYA